MRVFHGTTRAHAINILSGKEKGTGGDITWCCSDDWKLYFYEPTALAEAEYGDDLEGVDIIDLSINSAFESAQITAATSDQPQTELVVLEFDIPKELLEIDDSCENMEYARTAELTNYSQYFTREYTCKHNSRLDAIVLGNYIDNPNANIDYLDSDLYEAAQALQGTWLDSLLEFDWS